MLYPLSLISHSSSRFKQAIYGKKLRAEGAERRSRIENREQRTEFSGSWFLVAGK